MSWSAAVPVTPGSQFAEAVDTCPTEPEESQLATEPAEQLKAARAAVKDLVASGAVGNAESSSFRAQMSGHANPEHDPNVEDGSAEMISVSVYQS